MRRRRCRHNARPLKECEQESVMGEEGTHHMQDAWSHIVGEQRKVPNLNPKSTNEMEERKEDPPYARCRSLWIWEDSHQIEQKNLF